MKKVIFLIAGLLLVGCVNKNPYEKYKYESNEYLIELYKRTQKNEILSILIEKNKKYFFMKAKQVSYYYNHDLSEEDLYQIAVMGFVIGCQKFDFNKGYNLLTYATYWIKQAITKAIINKGKTIRLPAHIADKISKITNISTQFDLWKTSSNFG